MAKALAPPSTTGPLYEEDFPLWAEHQAPLLRAVRFEELDLDNLIEEVEDLSRHECDTVESHVETVIEHLVELTLSPAQRPRRGWLVTVDRHRAKLRRKLTASLRTHLEAELPALYDGLRRPIARQLEKNGVQPNACLRSAPTRSTAFSIRTGTRTMCTGSRWRSRDGAMLLIPLH